MICIGSIALSSISFVVNDIDFEDRDAEVTVTGSFEDDDDLEFDFEAVVVIKDGKVDDLKDIVVVHTE